MKSQLSKRELEILRLIILEFTTIEIANRLYVSAETIKTHRRNLLNKLSVRNVAGMVRRAFEFQLFSPHEIAFVRNN